MSSNTDHGRGKIQDDALAALVTSKVYRAKSEKPKKGKGSFKRKAKHKGRDIRPYFLVFADEIPKRFTVRNNKRRQSITRRNSKLDPAI